MDLTGLLPVLLIISIPPIIIFSVIFLILKYIFKVRFQALGHSMIPLLFFHGVVVLIAITALVIVIPPLIQKIKKITKKS